MIRYYHKDLAPELSPYGARSRGVPAIGAGSPEFGRVTLQDAATAYETGILRRWGRVGTQNQSWGILERHAYSISARIDQAPASDVSFGSAFMMTASVKTVSVMTAFQK